MSADGGAPVQVSGPLPAQRLSCRRSGGGSWLAAGDGLLESFDQGRTFRPRADAPAGPVRAVARTRDRIWLVAAQGIHTIPSEEVQPASVGGPAGGR